jgi:ATP-dependent helicase/nuclease subunit B
LACSRGVSVVLTADGAACRDNDIFRVTRRMAGKLRELAAETGKPCRVVGLGGPGGREAAVIDKPGVLTHVERELFSYPFKRFVGDAPELTLLRAANYYAEAESAAAEITRLIRDEGYRYRDILVACNDLETRGAVIKRVFSECGLPVFMDRRQSLLHNPVLEYIATLMDAVAGGWKTDDMLRLVKTGMSPVGPAQGEALEEYAREFRVRGKAGWTRTFDRVSPYERGGAARRLSEAEGARAALAGHVSRFAAMISEGRGAADRTKALYLFLRDEARLPQRLAGAVETLGAAGRREHAGELSQVWGQAVAVFDQIVAVLGDEPISRDDYAAMLAAGLEGIEIGMIPGSADQILVGTMQRTRAGRVKALFVLGANDGVLPASASRDSLLSEDERAAIFERGGEIGKLESLMAEEERLAIYRNMSRPRRRLWMSYSVSDTEGGELRPSLIFEKLKKIFPGAAVENDVCNRESPLDMVTAKESAMTHLAAALRELADGRRADAGVWAAVAGWFRVNAPHMLEPVEAGFMHSNRRGRIGRDYVRRLYSLAAPGDLAAPAAAGGAPGGGQALVRLGPSALERYSRCPFSHFVSYGLRPRESRLFEIGPRERGDLLHKVMMLLSQELTTPGVAVSGEGSRWMGLTREECGRLVDGIFARLIDEAGVGEAGFAEIFRQGRPEQYRARRIREAAKAAAWAAAEQVKAGAVEEMFFEERFGAGMKFPPISRVFEDGAEVRVEGQIDRLDVLRGGRAKIVDYKSGGERFDIDEARGGWRLQLLLYLIAVTDRRGDGLKPAGAFYFKISEPRVDCGAWASGECGPGSGKLEREMRKCFKLDGVALDDQDSLKAIAGEAFDGAHYYRGNSDIMPVRAVKDGATGEARLVKSHPSSKRLLGEGEFNRLMDDVERKALELCEALADGVIDAAPKRGKDASACKFCRYKAICAYDPAFEP